MNINLIYQGNNYNFDLRKDINIRYIQDLASKLITRDISTFELFYKNDNLSDYQDSTLLKDLVKDDKNISIIIKTKESINFSSNEKNKKLKKLEDLEQSKNSMNINDLKIMLNTPPIGSLINSKNKNTNIKLNLSKNKKNKNTLEYISENKVFEDIYNSKENEIISLMNVLSQKIKEYDDVLYKSYKNKSERGNDEVSLYEKNIIDFKNNQIRYLKKLLNYFNATEKDFISGVLPLTDFYIDLKQYNNPKTIDINNNNFNKKKVNNNKNNYNDKSKIKLDENNYSRNDEGNKKLPLLIDNKSKKSKYYLSHNNNTINSDDINENNSDFEAEQKLFKEHILNSENKNKNRNKNIINNYKDLFNKEKINKTKKDNNINVITSQNLQNKKNTKAISLSNTNDNTNLSNSTSVQGKNTKSNIIINKKREYKNNNLFIKSKSNQQSKRVNTFLKNKDKNKINILFEEPKGKLEIISNNDDNSSNISQSSSKQRFSKDSNKDLSRIGEEKHNTFRRDKYSTKGINKYKKIGSNIYDFII